MLLSYIITAGNGNSLTYWNKKQVDREIDFYLTRQWYFLCIIFKIVKQ